MPVEVHEVSRAIVALCSVKPIEVLDDPHNRGTSLLAASCADLVAGLVCSSAALVFVTESFLVEIGLVIGSLTQELVAWAAEQLLIVFDVVGDHLVEWRHLGSNRRSLRCVGE